MKTLPQLADELSSVRKERLALERKAEELKKREDELQHRIIFEMTANGMKSANFENVGRLVIKDAVRYEVADIEVLARSMLERMVKNHQEGRPLSDGLLLQQRVAKRNVEELTELSGCDPEKYAEQLGMRRVVMDSLTFTVAKGDTAM